MVKINFEAKGTNKKVLIPKVDFGFMIWYLSMSKSSGYLIQIQKTN